VSSKHSCVIGEIMRHLKYPNGKKNWQY